jgi:hypothetical protein
MPSTSPGTTRPTTLFDQRLELGLIDTYIFVISSDGSLLASNEGSEGEESTTNSTIEGLALPVDGICRIETRSYADPTVGAHTLVSEPVGNGKL